MARLRKLRFLEVTISSRNIFWWKWCSKISRWQWRSSYSQMFFKVGVFDTPAQVFSCEICEIFKNRFFTEHLQWLLLTMLSVRKLLQQFVFLFTLLFFGNQWTETRFFLVRHEQGNRSMRHKWRKSQKWCQKCWWY